MVGNKRVRFDMAI